MQKITITVKDVASLLGVSTNTIYTMVRENQIPNLRIRGKIMFNRNIIEVWARGEYQMDKQDA